MDISHIGTAVRMLSTRSMSAVVLAAPAMLIVDQTWPGNKMWHDAFMISTTIIGWLLVQGLQGFRKAQRDLIAQLAEVKKSRNDDRDAIKLAYASELGLLNKKLGCIKNLLIVYSFKLFQDDDDRQHFIKELNESGD